MTGTIPAASAWRFATAILTVYGIYQSKVYGGWRGLEMAYEMEFTRDLNGARGR